MRPSQNDGVPLELALEPARKVFDAVWTGVVQLLPERSHRRVLLTSAERGAGTTVIAAATALGIARNLRVSVGLVEANIERPALASYLGLAAGAPGLSELLAYEAEVQDCFQSPDSCPTLRVLPGGRARKPSRGEFATEAAGNVLQAATSSASFVIVDAPPILDHPETRLLLDHVDCAIVVARARSTRRAELKATVRALEDSGVSVLGAVMNRFKSDLPFHRPRP